MKLRNKVVRSLMGLLLVLGAIEVNAHQEKLFLFAGKLEKDSVVFLMEGHDDIWNVNGFYTSSLETIFLSNSETDSGVFQFVGGEDSVVIADKGKKKIVKWYRQGKKIKSNIRFVGEYKFEDLPSYSFRKNFLNYEKYSENDSIRFFRETHSNIPFFRLYHKEDSLMNNKLKEMHELYALQKIDASKHGFTFNYQLLFLDSNFLSFETFTKKKINENFSEDKHDFFNFRFQNAEPLQLEELLYFKSGTIPIYHSESWFTYRYNEFPVQLLKILPIEDSCLEDESLWQFPTWYLKDNKIWFKPFATFGKEECDLDKEFGVKLR